MRGAEDTEVTDLVRSRANAWTGNEQTSRRSTTDTARWV